jgi:toxin ParE1/3/4
MFEVCFTVPAEEDLVSILRYISDVLKATSAAKQLLDRIEEQTKILEASPFCYAIVSDDYLASKGIRSLLVKNYLIFFVVDEEKLRVSIIRIVYARRDWAYLIKKDQKHDSNPHPIP